MTPFLPILPVLLLALFCAIAGFWSLRGVDRLLTSTAAPVRPNQFDTGTDTQVPSPH
jgi:hypothetical protein